MKREYRDCGVETAWPKSAKKTDLILGAAFCALIVTLIILAWLTWGAS